MKVLGISMGRKNERSDIYCKQALMGVEAAAKASGKEIEVEFINTVTMDIEQCRGCGACSKAPDGKIKCIFKDDYLELEEKVLDADGIIINPAAYTHTSVAILDALKAVHLPAAEVHISDVNKREPFRQVSYAGMACEAHYIGLGFEGYLRAMEYLAEKYARSE
jgi:ferredoxin